MRAPLGVDYEVDAQPSIVALARGDLSAFMHDQGVLGPISVVLRAPLVALARALDQPPIWQYRAGAAICLVPCAVAALLLAGHVLRRGAPASVAVVVAALLAVNPLVFNALQAGHPEEVLAATLGVAAPFAVARGRPLLGLLLLAAAVATKQSALVAVAPVLFALEPRLRWRALAGLAVATIVLLAPYAIGGHSTFWASNVHLLRGSPVALPFSPWWLLGAGADGARAIPAWIGPAGRVATLVAPLLFAVALTRRRGRLDLDGALALLAFACLLRCVLDPADNPYYHVPAVFALAAWAAQRRRGVPGLAVVTTLLLWALIVGPWRHGDSDLVALLYLLWALPLTVGLGAYLARRAGGAYETALTPGRSSTMSSLNASANSS